MRRCVLISVVMLNAVLLLAASRAESGLRCSESLVTRGQTSFEVFERCGSPEFSSQFADYRYPGILVHVDEWTYHLGRNKFRRLLRFENGRLVRIELRRKPKRSLTPAFDMSRDQ